MTKQKLDQFENSLEIGAQDDFLILQNENALQQQKKRRTKRAWFAVIGIFFGIIVITIGSIAHRRSVNQNKPGCLYPLGVVGGHHVDYSQWDECKGTIAQYIKGGQYKLDLDTIQKQWDSYFSEEQFSNIDRSQLVVLDIDETAISNAQFIIEKGSDRSAKEWSNHIQNSDAPAIKQTLELYQRLYNEGFSVTFITGRHDIDREATVQQLKTAGYGSQCRSTNDGAVGPSYTVYTKHEPCYIQLDMRNDDDRTSLASVFKPQRREALVKKGYKVVGLLGDQWSDLSGLHSAPGAFKLPNPMYYIL